MGFALLIYERSCFFWMDSAKGSPESPRSGAAGLEQPLEGGAGALFGARVAQQPVGVVVAEDDGVEVEGELLGVEAGAEVAGLDRQARRLGEGGEAPRWVGRGNRAAARAGRRARSRRR